MLILQTLARGKPLHGFEIAESIQQTSADVLQVEEGSLYPALQRMLVKGWIAGDWGKTAENRRARYYRTTPQGLAIWSGNSPGIAGWPSRSRASCPRPDAAG